MLSRLVKFSTPLLSTPMAITFIQINETGPSPLRVHLAAPVEQYASGFGDGVLTAVSALGIGALCCYGMKLGRDKSSIESNSKQWPQYVRERIHSTFAYVGGSLTITAISAAVVFNSPGLLHLTCQNGFGSFILFASLILGTGIAAHSIPYEEGFGAKQIAWASHCAAMGAVLAPISFIGGPILLRAALYTAGIVGGLSTVAVCAPNDKFLYLSGPLAMGLGVVCVSSIGSAILPETTAIGAACNSLSLYGGLLLFGGFLLYDTQHIIHKAKTHATDAERKYDPINGAIGIYADTLNIFIRIAHILAERRRDRRRRGSRNC